MQRISGIYKIQSLSHPERCYIGSAQIISRRWNGHISLLKKQKHHSIKLQRHYNKYGIEDLLFSVICECSEEELIQYEQLFLDINEPYFNNRKIAESNKGHTYSQEIRDRMSKSRMGHRHSEETKEKIRQKKIGVPLTDYHKQRSSEGHKGIKNPHTKEWNEKISKAQIGRKLTEDHKKKLSIAKIGHIPWNKGLKTGSIPWNKGKKGVQENWKKGKIKVNGEYICQN